ncbi:hypothetical protein P7K49_023498 [Saguinus oedipus]|uniref:Uncharacterized protein n=1 Tax=Saguinus oedipus TaxID=9490 RepID=A0ABQ9UP38_SAGOE|nr:hypothetical protein P7K49_023498 [Saguinus oedipus]
MPEKEELVVQVVESGWGRGKEKKCLSSSRLAGESRPVLTSDSLSGTAVVASPLWPSVTLFAESSSAPAPGSAPASGSASVPGLCLLSAVHRLLLCPLPSSGHCAQSNRSGSVQAVRT